VEEVKQTKRKSVKKEYISVEPLYSIKKQLLRGNSIISNLEKVNEVIDNLNLEKAFFDNPNTYERAKNSYNYLIKLSNMLRIFPNVRSKIAKGRVKNVHVASAPIIDNSKKFNGMENIMILKENLDENQLKFNNKINKNKNKMKTITFSKIKEEEESKSNAKPLSKIKKKEVIRII